MKLAAVAGILLLAAAGARADDAPALLERYKCSSCHADNETKAGPAYVDVAAAYRGVPKASAKLAAIIRHGAQRGGPWHMPPHPEISAADANVMVRYILSRKSSP